MIEIKNLSSEIDTESFRVSGLGTACLLVATCSLDRYPEIQTSDPIRILLSQVRELSYEREVLETEITILKGFGKNMANIPDLTPDSASSFSDTLFEKTLSNAAAVRELGAKITDLDRKINRLRDAKAGETHARAVITIVAEEAGPAELRLTYRESYAQSRRDTVSTLSLIGVDDAEWRPLYDLYAYSQDGKPSTSVSLHYRVKLSQSTGEDWNDARLILSTSETDVLNAGVPASDGLVIEPKPKRPPPPPQMRAAVSKRTKQTARKSTMPAEPPAPVEDSSSSGFVDEDYEEFFEDFSTTILQEMSEGGAAISKSLMALNYTVDELTTIPSDDESHKVLVAIVPLESVISHITTPRKSPLAYLQVRRCQFRSIIQLIASRRIVLSEEY